MAEPKHEKGKPASEHHPEDIVPLEDEDDRLGIPSRVRLVVASAFAVWAHGISVWESGSVRATPYGTLEVLQLDARIDTVARLEEGRNDDPRQATEARTNETVFQVFGAPDHEHDSGHEQPSEEEQNSDSIQDARDLSQILLKTSRNSENRHDIVDNVIHKRIKWLGFTS